MKTTATTKSTLIALGVCTCVFASTVCAETKKNCLFFGCLFSHLSSIDKSECKINTYYWRHNAIVEAPERVWSISVLKCSPLSPLPSPNCCDHHRPSPERHTTRTRKRATGNSSETSALHVFGVEFFCCFSLEPPQLDEHVHLIHECDYIVGVCVCARLIWMTIGQHRRRRRRQQPSTT